MFRGKICMYLMLYVKCGIKSWKVSFECDELEDWAYRNLNTRDGNDYYHITELSESDLQKELHMYCTDGNKSKEHRFCGVDGKAEYTAGSDGKYYVCVPSDKSYIESEVEKTEPLAEDYENNYDMSVILDHADKEFCIWDIFNGISLDYCRWVLCHALSEDEDLSLRLEREGRIPNPYGYLWWTQEWGEEQIMSLISYLRFTRTLCTGVRLLYDELKRRNM